MQTEDINTAISNHNQIGDLLKRINPANLPGGDGTSNDIEKVETIPITANKEAIKSNED